MVVAPSSSSTKKAAKLAKSGQGKKVRFQGGTLFPMVVTIVIVLGLALVVYARQSRPSVDASGAPTVSDHWHHAYGFYLCDTWFKLEGNAEQQGTDNFTQYQRTGIHSHDDGLIHWHPFSSAAVGSNATLGVFLDTYDVKLTNDKLTFPESQRSALETQLAEQPPRDDILVWEDGDDCTIDGSDKSAELKVVVWNNFTDTDDGTDLHRRLRQHPSRPRPDGRRDRLRARRHRRHHAALGAGAPQPGRGRQRRRQPQRSADSRGDHPGRLPAHPEGSTPAVTPDDTSADVPSTTEG